MKTSEQNSLLPSGKSIRVILLCVALFALFVSAVNASEVVLPDQSDLYMQTNGAKSTERNGDWWTHEEHGKQSHLFKIVVPAGVNNFNMAIELFDPESYCNDVFSDPDEQGSNGAWEDTRFRLLESNRSTVVYEYTYSGGSTSSNQKWVPFHSLNVTGPREYYLDVNLLAGSALTTDDANGYRIRIVNGNTDNNETNGNEISLYAIRTAFVMMGDGDLSCSFDFEVPADKPEIHLYNYDMDGQGPITYIDPDGTEYEGTVSGTSKWNTNPPITTLPSNGGDVFRNPKAGWWQARFNVRHEDGKNHNANRFVFWPGDMPFCGCRPRGALIGDRIWRDENQNGLQDRGETGVGNIKVNLLNAETSQVLRSTKSAPNGTYWFWHVPYGTYMVEFVIDNAKWFFSPDRIGSNRNIDSDADPNSGRTGIISISKNMVKNDIDAGLIPKNVSNLLVRKMITATSNRFYPDDEFTFQITVRNQGPHAANNVRVMDQLPEGVTFVSAVPPANSGPDPLVWYEPLLAANAELTYAVTVKAGKTLGTYENCVFVSSPNRDTNLNDNSSCAQFFILERPAVDSNIRIGDRVWIDADQDGLQDTEELGKAGVTVQLLSSPDASLISQTITDENGLYRFDDVAPGAYLLAFVLSADHHFTLRDQAGDDNLDSDADPATGRTIPFEVIAEHEYLTWDAGMVPNEVPEPIDNQIGDYVWEDSNANGLQDTEESGLAHVSVRLLSSPSATLVATTETDDNGHYAFNDVAPGDYLLVFTLLEGYHFTVAGQPGDAVNSDANVATGRTVAFTIGAHQVALDWDAGMIRNDVPQPTGIIIGDRVWHDINKNGLQDNGEPGVKEVPVNLLSNGSNTLVRSTVTDNDGLYQFKDVPAGSYSIEFVLPDNFAFTQRDAGDDAIDSDAEPTTGRTVAFAVIKDQHLLTWDAGLKERTTSDLQVVKTVSGNQTYYYRNQEVTFKIRVTNTGPQVAQAVRIIDTIPEGLIFISATPVPSSGPNPLIWNITSMAVGETIEISLVMQTTEQLGGMDNCVNVSSSSVDPDLTNNISCAQIHILVPVELSSFSARSLNHQVVLEWVTQSETENLGFHLLRSDVESGPYTQITQAMVKGAGTSATSHHYQYQDLSAGESKTYYYKLVDVDYNGRLSLHGPINVTVELPTVNLLEQNYPNPFNPTTKIRFILKEQGAASLTIYNIKGELVRELVSTQLNAGAHIVEWDGMDQNGQQVPSGMYLYSLRMNGFEQKRMMMFLK